MVETILQAATRVFTRLGYPQATTNRIAAAAGISVGSLYQYFSSKDAIAVELLRRYRERLVALVGDRMSAMSATSLESIVRALVEALVRAEGIDPALHRVLIEQVLRTDARGAIVGFEERLEALVARAIRAAPAGARTPDPDVAAFVLVRSVLGTVHAAVVDRPGIDRGKVADELTRWIVRYLGA
jgi:AcrR family transcriptional regulator